VLRKLNIPIPIISIYCSANSTDILLTFKIAKPHQPLTLKKKNLFPNSKPSSTISSNILEQSICAEKRVRIQKVKRVNDVFKNQRKRKINQRAKNRKKELLKVELKNKKVKKA